MALISIGIPAFNAEVVLARALDSLLLQTLSDFEIIISDNCSTDRTADIGRDYAARDQRIRYIRQERNIGAFANFKAVLDQARAPYFMWSACDDVRSPDFLELNVRFLQDNPEFVASTCPNCFDDQPPDRRKLVTFAIEGSKEDRFEQFFDHGWDSHGIFYSVMRTEVVRQCPAVGQNFLGVDWAVDLFLASHGNINRTETGLLTLGAGGVSNSERKWSTFRDSRIGWIVPFYRVSLYGLAWSSDFPMFRRLGIVLRLLKLNAFAARKQLKFEAMLFFREKKGRFARRFGWG